MDSAPRGTERFRIEQRDRATVKPLELFFDLVFVLTFTQCTALMSSEPTWPGVAKGMLALAAMWWAWCGYAWLTSLVEPEEGPVRLMMLAAMAGLLVAAICLPESFGDRALGFALAYGLVRLGHIALYLIASRDNHDLRRSVVSIGVTTAIVVGLLVGASFTSGATQVALWSVAILLDWSGAVVADIGGWTLTPAHFAERYNLVIILALGETVVAIGTSLHTDLTAPFISAAVLGLGVAAALWWTYFDVVALVTEQRLQNAAPGRERNRLARDSYSYLHYPMVAGIVLGAFGLHQVLEHTDRPLDAIHAAALLGGTALYLLAHVALRLRNAHTISVPRLTIALVLLAAIPAALHVDALITTGAINVLLWAMIAFETYQYDDRRYRLRHGLDIEVPGAEPNPRSGDDPPPD